MRDIMLQIDTYAEPLPPAAIAQAVGFARALDAELTGLATHIDIKVPDNWLAERLLHVNDMARAEEAKSLASGEASLALLHEHGKDKAVTTHGVIVRLNLHSVGPCVAQHARTRDLSLVCVGDRMDSQRSVAEDVIFGSGQPVVVFHPERAPLPVNELVDVCIAWDGSRSAARAAASAMPLLRRAKAVQVLTIVGEKPSATSGLGRELVRHLRMHGVTAETDELDGRGRSIGASIDAYVEECAPQLMIMGAYGGSRLKEFVLGGATEHVLNRPHIPILLAH